MPADIKRMYSTVVKDDFPPRMEICFIDGDTRQTLCYEKVTWAIDETRGLLDAQRARFLEQQKQQAAQKNARALAAETPMGRTGAAPKPKAYDDAPFSLDDALNAAYEARRL